MGKWVLGLGCGKGRLGFRRLRVCGKGLQIFRLGVLGFWVTS